MRFWTAYAFFALSIASKAWSSSEGHGGEHHASINDLIAPAINVAILFGVLIYVTKDKLRSFFISKSDEVANTLQRADIKAKEAALMLENQNKKMMSLDSELKNIEAQAEADVLTFEKSLAKETEEKISKMKLDANSKVAADKKQMVDELNAELLEQVINKTKSTIKNNKDYQSKVSTKMLQGLK
jgi:F0F1-type ATP synthase membrane subunit b/b'